MKIALKNQPMKKGAGWRFVGEKGFMVFHHFLWITKT